MDRIRNRVKIICGRPGITAACLAILMILPAASMCCRPVVEPMGLFGKSRMRHVLGQDGVTPIDFNEKITLWTFGDTILGEWKGDVSVSATFSDKATVTAMLSNSLAFTGALDDSNIADPGFVFYRENGEICQFIKYGPNENPARTRLWALDGVRIGDDVYVYYIRVRITDPGKVLAFKVNSIGIARWRVPKEWKPGKRVSFVRLPDLFKGGVPAFGACVYRKNGYIYTIGHYNAGDGDVPVKIARVRETQIADALNYEFLKGDGSWNSRIEEAESFFYDVMGECSLSYNERLKQYIIVYCQKGTGRIVVVRFDNFSELGQARKTDVYVPPELPSGKPATWYYSGKEIFSAGRDIFAIYIHPLEYQPYLIRVRL